MIKAKEIAEQLVQAGVNILWTSKGFSPESGFYKSDGCAQVVDEEDGAWLLSRYDRRKRISTLKDVVEESYWWWRFSCNRANFWETPTEPWAALYGEFVEDEGE